MSNPPALSVLALSPAAGGADAVDARPSSSLAAGAGAGAVGGGARAAGACWVESSFCVGARRSVFAHGGWACVPHVR